MSANWKRNVIMLSCSQLMVMAGFDAMNPFIPLFMKTGLGLTEETGLPFYISLYSIMGFLGYGIANPLWGWLGDRYGMKVMLLRGTFLSALFWPMMAHVSSPVTLALLRFTTAFLAGTTSASQMMIARNTPLERLGFAQGLLLSAYFSGSMLGNLAGGLIIHCYSHRAAFWLCGAMYLLAGFFILFTEDKGSVADDAIAQAPQTTDTPRPQRRLLLPPMAWMLLGLFVLNALIRRTELPFIALRVEQLTSKQSADYWTGIVSFAVGVGAILSGVIIGRLVDRIPPPRLILPILFGTGLFTLLQGVLDNLWLFMGSRTLCYFIAGAIQPLLQKLLTIQTPRDKRGLAFGIGTTAFSIGGILASTIGGAVMKIGGVSAVFVVGGTFAFLSAPLFLPVVKRASPRTIRN